MDRIQFAYLRNNYYVFVTNDRDIEFRTLNNDDTVSMVINPDKGLLKYILTSDTVSIKDLVFDIFFGILTQLPSDCGVFSNEYTKLRVLVPENGYKVHNKINEYVSKLWSKYSELSANELIDLIYDSLYKIAKNIPIELFINEGGLTNYA